MRLSAKAGFFDTQVEVPKALSHDPCFDDCRTAAG